MRRNTLWAIATLVVVIGWSADSSLADDPRLKSSYRGPLNTKTADKDDSATDTSDSGGDADASGPSAGDSGDGGGGLDESGAGAGAGDDGSTPPPDDGGDSGAPDSGGSDLGGDSGSGTSQGTGSADSGGTGLGSGGSSGSGGSRPGGGGGGASATRAFEVVSWYFEHNRERLIYGVAEQRNRRITPTAYSSIAIHSYLPRDERSRTLVSSEQRTDIFQILKNNAVADQAVVRDAAIIALGKFGGKDAVEILKQRLAADPVRELKQDALLALGLTRDPTAIPLLKDALDNRQLRSFALMGLALSENGETAGPIVLEYFKKALKQKTDVDTLCCAAMALGSLQHADAVSTLATVVNKKKSADRLLKVYAVHALGNIGGADAQKALGRALDKGHMEVARAALLALGGFANKDAVKTLTSDGLKTPDQLAKGFACVSLGQVLAELPESEWKKAPDSLKKVALKPAKDPVACQYAYLALTMFDGVDNEVQRFFTESLTEGKLDRETLSAICLASGLDGLSAVSSQLDTLATDIGVDPELQGYAALALGMVSKNTETAEKLRELFRNSNREDVRRSALVGLGLVGDGRDVQTLVNIIARPVKRTGAQYTRGAAVTALGLIRDGSSVKMLKKLLSKPDPRTRAYAVAALGYLGDKDQAPAMSQLFEDNNFRQEFPTLKVVMSHL